MAAVELTAPGGTTGRVRRVVVALGASNLSRGLPRLLSVARARCGGPVDLVVAAGHGRSYGVNSRVGIRRLPSILWSGLWRALDRLAEGPPACGLVTDIGNDLLYGFSPEQTAGWVEECLTRLASRGVQLAITRLPLASVARVGPAREWLLKTVYVPGCRLSRHRLVQSAERLDALIVAAARRHGATVVDQPGAWYGFDSIHVRRHRLAELWQACAEAWDVPAATAKEVTLAEWARVGSRAAEVRGWGRRVLRTPQPAATFADGSRLHLY